MLALLRVKLSKDNAPGSAGCRLMTLMPALPSGVRNDAANTCIQPASTISSGLSFSGRARIFSASAASYLERASVTLSSAFSPLGRNPLLIRLKYSHGMPIFAVSSYPASFSFRWNAN